jgi:hypothetical protein
MFVATLLALACMAGLRTAYADNDYNVYSPNLVEGQSEVEMRSFDYQDARSELNTANGTSFSVAHTFTDWWKSELYVAEFNRAPGYSSQLTGYEFENTFQLTDPGEYWADAGLLVSYAYAKVPGVANNVELALLLEKRVGRFDQKLNLIREKYMGNDAPDIISTTNLVRKGKGKGKGTTVTTTVTSVVGAPGGYPSRFAYSANYKFSDDFMPGIEAYYHAGDNGFQIGPVVYGEIRSSSGSELEYSIGGLYGTNSLSPTRTYLARLEYDFF